MRGERLGNLPAEVHHLADASIEVARSRLGEYPSMAASRAAPGAPRKVS